MTQMFKAGDRVHHVTRNEDGTVLPFDTACIVRVEFDRPMPRGGKSIGEYDEVWFRNCPGLLKLIGDRRA